MICATTPIIIPPSDSLPNGSKQVCVLLTNENKTVSLALNDSCGSMKDLARADIRLRDGDDDVTDSVFGPLTQRYRRTATVCATLGNLEVAMNWLRRTKWGL